MHVRRYLVLLGALLALLVCTTGSAGGENRARESHPASQFFNVAGTQQQLMRDTLNGSSGAEGTDRAARATPSVRTWTANDLDGAMVFDFVRITSEFFPDEPNDGFIGATAGGVQVGFVASDGPILADLAGECALEGTTLNGVLVEWKPIGLTLADGGNGDAEYDCLYFPFANLPSWLNFGTANLVIKATNTTPGICALSCEFIVQARGLSNPTQDYYCFTGTCNGQDGPINLITMEFDQGWASIGAESQALNDPFIPWPTKRTTSFNLTNANYGSFDTIAAADGGNNWKTVSGVYEWDAPYQNTDLEQNDCPDRGHNWGPKDFTFTSGTPANKATFSFGYGCPIDSNVAIDDYGAGAYSGSANQGGGPTVGIVDSFNRANENPVNGSGGWRTAGDPRGSCPTYCQMLEVFNNELTELSVGQNGASTRNLQYSGNIEVYATIAQKPQVGDTLDMLWNINNLPGFWRGYSLKIKSVNGTYEESGKDEIRLARIQQDASDQNIGNVVKREVENMDKFMVRQIGSAIEVWHGEYNPGAAMTWTRILNEVHFEFTSGKVGVLMPVG